MPSVQARKPLPGLGLALPALVLGLWELAVRLGAIDPLFFPPPSALAGTAFNLLRSGDLLQALAGTLTRAASGFLPGALGGIALGAAIGLSPTARRIIEPSVSSVYSMPKLALLPVFLLILGVGETARIALIAVGTLLVMTMQVFDGVRGIDPGYVELARGYGASSLMVLRKVYLPGALPHIFTGARITFGRALVIAISVELVTGATGLGRLIWYAWQTFSAERLYVGVAAAGFLGFLSQSIFRFLERRLVGWRRA
ncbi:MAG: ABC transporter permease [Bryobacteraceae bacterium]